MKLPLIEGLIDRRILVNFQVDPEALAVFLPKAFRPRTVRRFGIAGICLIRLAEVRPRFVPRWLGLSSENAAHRIAVEWEQHGRLRQGVFIPRRDTSSQVASFLGGRFFPGLHHRADFAVEEDETRYKVRLGSRDGVTRLHVEGHVGTQISETSVFGSLREASDFFEHGSMGYSPAKDGDVLEGMELHTDDWRVEPLQVTRVESSFFDDTERFPAGSVRFDSALLMKRIQHQWHALPEVTAGGVFCSSVPG
ncbi:MAG: hypothetical protein GY711_28810 [bacterium]|nr:hypothetical protein [bacterium]